MTGTQEAPSLLPELKVRVLAGELAHSRDWKREMKSRSLFTVYALLMILLLSGCYTERIAYYRPDVSEGKVVTGKCHRLTNIPAAIRFDREGIRFYVPTPLPSEKDSISTFTVNSKIPSGSRIVFLAYNVKVSISDQVIEVRAQELKRNQYNILYGPVDERVLPLTDGQVLEGLSTEHESVLYILKFNLPFGKADAFTIQLPDILINDKKFVFPPIAYSLETELFLCPYYSS